MEKVINNTGKASWIDEMVGGPQNILVAVIIWIVAFVLLWILLLFAEWDNRFMIALALIASAIIAFGDSDSVEILKLKLLLFRGQETGKKVLSGFYFTFWIYTLDKTEEQTTEKMDVVIAEFNCQDKTGKNLKVKGNGDYRITNEDKFKLNDTKTMKENLASLVERTAIKVLGKLPYRAKNTGEEQIVGEDLASKIIQDIVFKRECRRYGIRFSNLIIAAIAADLTQENINSYYNELYEKELVKYEGREKPNHKEMQEIEERIQVKMKLARKIITNSPLLGRYDIQEQNQ